MATKINERPKITIRQPDDILGLLGKWKGRRQENFLIITLDGSHSVIKLHHVSKGLLNRTIVHPRECFWHAIKDYSAAVVFIHNHPSGNTKPSCEDDEITRRLCLAGKILGIHVLDHLIITKTKDFYSYREYGKIIEEFTDKEEDEFAKGLAAERS